MNRTDRLYALVEELRAAAPQGRSARWLAGRFEVSMRTIERDISALQQAGLPITAQPGRRGGYMLDKAMTLPPLNFTPAEALAMAVALGQIDRTPFAREARSALRKIVAVMPDASARRARELTATVRLLQPAADPLDTSVAEAVRQAVQHRRVLRIEYVDVRGERTTREVEPQLLVAGPRGWYLTGWCRLRQDVRAFRLDRVRSAVQTSEGFAERPSDLDTSAPPELISRIPVWE